jgi:hypothetical protein
MRVLIPVFLSLLVLGVVGCASSKPGPATSVLGADLPDWQQGEYNVEPYLQAAMSLQAQGKDTALQRLKAVARRDQSGHGAIVLCRMLFTPKAGSDFRRPMIGLPARLGATDWPLEPIAIVDGVPFMITRGYLVGGLPEPGILYVQYCETNCDWSSFRYTVKTQAEKEAALAKLISAPEWKTPLNKYEKEFLAAQIR